MVEITPSAEELLLELRGKHGDQTDGVRFETAAGRIRLAFASEARPTDRVLDGARLPIYVAPELADSFREAKIDAELTDGKQKIVVTRTRPAV
jgi:hypothetical protein